MKNRIKTLVVIFTAFSVLCNCLPAGAVLIETPTVKANVAHSTLIVKAKVLSVADALELANVYGGGAKVTATTLLTQEVYAGIAPKTFKLLTSPLEKELLAAECGIWIETGKEYVFFLREEYTGDAFAKTYFVPASNAFLFDAGNARQRENCALYRNIHTVAALKSAVIKNKKALATNVNFVGVRWRYPSVEAMAADSDLVVTASVARIVESREDRVIAKLTPKALYKAKAGFDWNTTVELPVWLDTTKDYMLFLRRYEDKVKAGVGVWRPVAREGAVLFVDDTEGKEAAKLLRSAMGVEPVDRASRFWMEPWIRPQKRDVINNIGFPAEVQPYAIRRVYLSLPNDESIMVWVFSTMADAMICQRRINGGASITVDMGDGTIMSEESLYPHLPTYYAGGNEIVHYVGESSLIRSLLAGRYEKVWN